MYLKNTHTHDNLQAEQKNKVMSDC